MINMRVQGAGSRVSGARAASPRPHNAGGGGHGRPQPVFRPRTAFPGVSAPVQGTACGVRRATRATVSTQATAQGDYDYILVGGGAAGCILANKLTADGTTRVLLLEAGGENNDPAVTVPAGLTRLFKSNLDWNLYSKSLPGANDANMYLARGKILGGSSSTNATLYHRGTASDYDAWGVPGWTSEDALKWFIDCEDNNEGANKMHGVGGGMHVENPRYNNKLHKAFFEGCEEAGLAPNPDFNDWDRPQEGYGQFQVCQEFGRRADMYRQYLKPAQGRENLTVETAAHTTRVVMDSSSGTPTATGVEYSRGGLLGEACAASVKAGGEVILTAGAVHTPQLMLLSGLGPAQELAEKGIQTVADLPAVGANLQDHPSCLAAFYTEGHHVSYTDEAAHEGGRTRVRALANYAVRGRGPLASTGCDRGAFLRSDPELPECDVQLRFVPAFSISPNGVDSYAMFGQYKTVGRRWPSGHTFQVIAVRPKNRGSVSLRSADPFDPPKVDTGSLQDEEDLRSLREGLRVVRKVAAGSAMQDWGTTEVWPGKDKSSDEELNEYIRRTLHSANALVGSCKMGTSPADSVVDPACKVFGTAGLRIIDSSVIPVLPGGQTGAATVMVAERMASEMMAA